ncbi:MAG: hypothetical protein J6A75_10850 [Lachnospiraceae bacterium]|nr:hypothetical protein [Lachnospiraceae bacterium]
MIWFELPDSETNMPINIRLLELMEAYPEFFYENVRIEAVYGCPPFCVWNGGCIHLPGQCMSPKELERIFALYSNYHLSYRLTFTNRLLRKEHLYDTYGNAIAKAGNMRGNSVIVATDVMQKYIHENYSNYSIIQSICRVYSDITDIHEALEKYFVCIPVRMNRQWEELSKLPYPENVIILANEYCPVSDCEYCQEHYESFNRFSLYQESDHMRCRYQQLRQQMDMQGEFPTHNIFPEDYEKYEQLGIVHFKLNGRASTPEQLVTLYCKYFVKPQYQKNVTKLLMI